MPIESVTYISDFVVTNPVGASDPGSHLDDHIRNMKFGIKTTFSNVSGAVTPSHTELNYMLGVTSAVQTQLDAKAPLASPTFTGAPAAPTAAAGTNTTQLATTAHVFAERANAATLTNKTISGASNTLSNVSLTTAVTGTLPVANGGTGATTLADAATALQGDGLTVTMCGFRGVPQNSQSAAYTTVAADAGKHIYHPAADVTARTWTIAANASVAYPIGTAITFDNDYGAGALTIAINTDTLVLVGTAGTTGSRTLASGGQATAIKVAATRWRISGTGLS